MFMTVQLPRFPSCDPFCYMEMSLESPHKNAKEGVLFVRSSFFLFFFLYLENVFIFPHLSLIASGEQWEVS